MVYTLWCKSTKIDNKYKQWLQDSDSIGELGKWKGWERIHLYYLLILDHGYISVCYNYSGTFFMLNVVHKENGLNVR